jgi:hypothetical protein
MNGEKRNGYRLLEGKSVGRRPIGKTKTELGG